MSKERDLLNKAIDIISVLAFKVSEMSVGDIGSTTVQEAINMVNTELDLKKQCIHSYKMDESPTIMVGGVIKNGYHCPLGGITFDTVAHGVDEHFCNNFKLHVPYMGLGDEDVEFMFNEIHNRMVDDHPTIQFKF